VSFKNFTNSKFITDKGSLHNDIMPKMAIFDPPTHPVMHVLMGHPLA